jgi:hypothetical protein
MERIIAHLQCASFEDLDSILTPDDYEDAVVGFLQSEGWSLVKSTCFRSKPLFECLMIRPGPRYARVQVKSGRVQLKPTDYARWVSSSESVFLLSTHPDPYPGEPVEGVHTLACKDVLAWLAHNPWFLPPGLSLRFQVALDSAARVAA